MPPQAEREFQEEEERRTHDLPAGTGFALVAVAAAALYAGLYFGLFST